MAHDCWEGVPAVDVEALEVGEVGDEETLHDLPPACIHPQVLTGLFAVLDALDSAAFCGPRLPEEVYATVTRVSEDLEWLFSLWYPDLDDPEYPGFDLQIVYRSRWDTAKNPECWTQFEFRIGSPDAPGNAGIAVMLSGECIYAGELIPPFLRRMDWPGLKP